MSNVESSIWNNQTIVALRIWPTTIPVFPLCSECLVNPEISTFESFGKFLERYPTFLDILGKHGKQPLNFIISHPLHFKVLMNIN